jgi:hypothetical protein
MPRYSQRRMEEIARFEDGPLTGFARVERAMAEVEQELMRAKGALNRYEVAIRTAQKLVREWRGQEMDSFQYPYRRRG